MRQSPFKFAFCADCYHPFAARRAVAVNPASICLVNFLMTSLSLDWIAAGNTCRFIDSCLHHADRFCSGKENVKKENINFIALVNNVAY